MKLPRLIEVLTQAASVCEDGGEECEVEFIVDDDELELVEMIGEGVANFPMKRGELAEFGGWQERLTVRFRVKGAEYNEGT